MRHWIIEKMPEHTLYCEPFCGAGHLLFAKTPSEVEVINDKDNHLIAFFKVIQDPETRQALINSLNYMPYSRALWQELRAKWKQGFSPDDGIERVAIWFYLNRATFSGDQENGGFAIPSVTGRNPSMSFVNAIEGLNLVAKRLKGVTIENLDYSDCIRKYDSKDTLFFCDPPYLNAENYYGRENFMYDDHQALARLLHEVKGKVMLTHYASPVYDDLYPPEAGWYRFEYNTFRGAYKAEAGDAKPKVTEVLYTNFEPMQNQNELFKNI